MEIKDWNLLQNGTLWLKTLASAQKDARLPPVRQAKTGAVLVL